MVSLAEQTRHVAVGELEGLPETVPVAIRAIEGGGLAILFTKDRVPLDIRRALETALNQAFESRLIAQPAHQH